MTDLEHCVMLMRQEKIFIERLDKVKTELDKITNDINKHDAAIIEKAARVIKNDK